jgi:hypothetical protein
MTPNQNSSLSKTIYQNMRLKETDELLEIWSENDRLEWSDDVFTAIYSILLERLGNVPPQGTRKSDRNRRQAREEKAKLPLPFTLMIVAFLLIVVLLSPLVEPKPDDQWFSILMLSLFSIFFFAPSFYFSWLGWIKSTETKQRIFNTLHKNKETRGILFRFHTIFLPDKYLPTFFLWEIRVFSIVLAYAGVKMLLLLANVVWQ